MEQHSFQKQWLLLKAPLFSGMRGKDKAAFQTQHPQECPERAPGVGSDKWPRKAKTDLFRMAGNPF